MDVFRGLIHKEEFSERGLILSQQLLSVNAASYTVWLDSFNINEQDYQAD